MNITNLADLADKRIIIYGAGSSGHQIYNLLTKKAVGIRVEAFCDTYKTGIDDRTGLCIVTPHDLYHYANAIFIIGLSDYLKPDEVDYIQNSLILKGIAPESVIKHSTILRFFIACDSDEFDWQKAGDGEYDFSTNLLLIGRLSECIEKTDTSVVDLGAGGMYLKKHLHENIEYYPVDYIQRCDETIVCDFNKGEFPNIYADVYVLCAVTYYLDDPVGLLEKCAKYAKRKIIVALNKQSMAIYPEVMHVHGFRNYMFFDEIEVLLSKYGFYPSVDAVVDSVARRYVMYQRQPDGTRRA